jgi:hypothetical protein
MPFLFFKYFQRCCKYPIFANDHELMLHKNLHIKRLLAGIMLVLFAFSVTPRNVLHDLFANHTDETVLSKRSNSTSVKTFDYLCKTDNLVVESPFIESITHFNFSAFAAYPKHRILTSYFFSSSKYFFFEHRGPPAVA